MGYTITQQAAEIAAFQVWREQQIATRPVGTSFVFCGHHYRVELTNDGRKILTGHTPGGYHQAA
jgi:hypothetical protein